MSCNPGRNKPLNFKRESDRLRSFEDCPVRFPETAKMAATGFFYPGKNEGIVLCVFCGLAFSCLNENDNPMKEHCKVSPNCQKIIDSPNELSRLDSSSGTLIGTDTGFDTYGNYGIEIRCTANASNSSALSNDVPSLDKFGIYKLKRPNFPKHASYEGRMKSFRDWPISLEPKPKALSGAGFFYSGRGDQVICFQCGLGIKDWEKEDDPWVEHARHSSSCDYVHLLKDEAFIKEFCGLNIGKLSTSSEEQENTPTPRGSEKVSDSASDPIDHESTFEPKISDNRLCRICNIEEMGVAFLPCGHIVACVECTFSLTTCPICGTPFLAVARIYLS